MVSNIPMKTMRQTCGNKQTPYIFRGAFTNRSFVYKNGEHIVFHFNVSHIKTFSPGLILFEFGVSKGAIERRDLLGPLSFNFYGWMLTVQGWGEVALINSEGRAVHSSRILPLDTIEFHYHIEFNSNGSIVLKTYDTNEYDYTFLDETRLIRGKPKLGFAKVSRPVHAYVTVKMSGNSDAFNKSTLYPTLYIADDNKTISNIQQSSLLGKQIQKKHVHVVQDIMLQNCKRKCVYVVNFRVDAPTVSNVFNMVLTNSEFLPSAHYNITLFSYVRCLERYAIEAFCLLMYEGNVEYFSIRMDPNRWHTITITVNRQRKSASFIVGTHEIELENGYIFEKDTPILRSVMLTMEDSVYIHLADSDEFEIIRWFNVKVFQYEEYIGSLIPFPFSRDHVIILVIVYSLYNRKAKKNSETSTVQVRNQMPKSTRRRRN